MQRKPPMAARVMRKLLPLLALTLFGLGQGRATPFVELEPNNSISEAQFLAPHDGSLSLTGIYNGPNSSGFIDDDFFRFGVGNGDLITASLTSVPSIIQMSMFLYDPTGLFTGVAVFGSQPSFAYPASVGGTYFLSVAGLTPFSSGNYRLQVAGLTPSEAVPEASTLLLLSVAIAALSVWTRQSKVNGK